MPITRPVVVVGAADGLPVRDLDPARRAAVAIEVGHRLQVGGDLDGDPAGDGVPVEEATLDVGDRDRARVVVGLLALLLGAVVPGGAAVVGVADQGVGVQVLQCLSRHVLPPDMRMSPGGAGIG